MGHHLSFNPRVREARRVAERLGDRLHAMLDVSDGLALDLHRLCESSEVGAVIHEEELERVISDAAKEASRKDGRSALEHALSDGEDFELLMAVEGGVHDVDVPLLGLGELTEAGVLLRHRNATTSPLEKKGFVH